MKFGFQDQLFMKKQRNFFWVFALLMIWCNFDIFRGFGSLETGLLCIVGELPGRGYVFVAVGISDR